MNYYIDTEFLEGTQDKTFLGFKYGKTKPTIDLISIGIVSEDGREFYAISKDFNLKEAWNRFDLKKQKLLADNVWQEDRIVTEKEYWLRDNVLKPIWIDLFLNYEAEFTFLKGKAYDQFEKELKEGKHDKYFTYKSLRALINRYGKTNKQIAEEIVKFVYPNALYNHLDCKVSNLVLPNCADSEKPKFYAYYADYDWVVFCQLFGKMIDLPKGFPMYCFELKQNLDEKFPEPKLSELKLNPFSDYPQQENEHSAIHDARWNKKLHEFLKSI